jgi:hypothetical protein
MRHQSANNNTPGAGNGYFSIKGSLKHKRCKTERVSQRQSKRWRRGAVVPKPTVHSSVVREAP